MTIQHALYRTADRLTELAGDCRWTAHCTSSPAVRGRALTIARVLDAAALLLETRAEARG